jgi:Immunity protein 26
MTKTKAKRIRARVGDVFVVPISADERVYGQVVDRAGPQFLAVLFRSTSGSVEDIVRSGIQLAGIVFDAKWRNGDWPIIANRPPVKLKAPWFVLGHEGLENLRLTNFDSSITRQAASSEASKHRHRHISYPMALQWAAEAVHGRREWNEDLDFFRDLAIELDGDPAT